MNKEEIEIGKIMEEMINRPLELIEENQKLKKKIEKLQKENKELKVDNKKLNDLLMFSELDYISKDIIRNKIKELKNTYSEHSEFRIGKIIEILEELLGE